MPQFASKNSPPNNIAATDYVYKALIFESKEDVEKFIKERRRADFEPHCFRYGDFL